MKLKRVAEVALMVFLLMQPARAGQNPLIGSWWWNPDKTLQQLREQKDIPESLRPAAEKARAFVEAQAKALGSNVRFTYSETECIETIFDANGNVLSNKSSSYRIVKRGKGYMAIKQQHNDEVGKVFFADNSFYVKVTVDGYTYRDYFTKDLKSSRR